MESGFSRKSNAPSLVALHGGLDVSVPRNHHHHGPLGQMEFPGCAPGSPCRRCPAARHPEIPVRGLPREVFQALFSARHRARLIAFVAQHPAQRLLDTRLVIDYQNARGFHACETYAGDSRLLLGVLHHGGNFDGKARAHRPVIFHADVRVVIREDMIHDGEPQARAPALGREVRAGKASLCLPASRRSRCRLPSDPRCPPPRAAL